MATNLSNMKTGQGSPMQTASSNAKQKLRMAYNSKSRDKQQIKPHQDEDPCISLEDSANQFCDQIKKQKDDFGQYVINMSSVPAESEILAPRKKSDYRKKEQTPRHRRNSTEFKQRENEQMLYNAKYCFKKAQKYYKQGDYFDCLNKIQRSLQQFDRIKYELTSQLKQTHPQVYEHVKDCYLQSASCYIRIKQLDESENLLNRILDIESDNLKALYLRGCTYESDPKNLETALKDFQKALNLAPENQLIKQHYEQLNNRLKQEQNKDLSIPIKGARQGPLVSPPKNKGSANQVVPSPIIQQQQEVYSPKSTIGNGQQFQNQQQVVQTFHHMSQNQTNTPVEVNVHVTMEQILPTSFRAQFKQLILSFVRAVKKLWRFRSNAQYGYIPIGKIAISVFTILFSLLIAKSVVRRSSAAKRLM